jgi:DNA gyrase subunit B
MLTKKLVSLGSEDFNYTSSDGANVINGTEMPELLAILSSAEDLCTRLSKQNVDVKRFFELRDATTGEFPRYRVITDIDGNPEDHYVFKFDEAEALKAKTAAELGCEIAVLDEPENPNYTCTEILQADTLRRQMDTLHEVYHFECGDFYDAGREIGVLTDKSGRTYPVTSLMSFLNTIRDRGRKGLTIQRYKGLGEMDADQLADTTMYSDLTDAEEAGVSVLGGTAQIVFTVIIMLIPLSVAVFGIVICVKRRFL